MTAPANEPDRPRESGIPRRSVLLGATALIAGAGCVGGDETADVGSPASDHPVAEIVDEVPSRGADPFEGAATLVVYDDPRCPSCQRFHEEVVAAFEADFGEEGSLVYAPYPVTYPEAGRAAWNLLLATHDEDDAAFWDLQDHFVDLGSFSAADVFETGEAFLSDRLDDATAGRLVEAARAGAHDAFIDESVEVAEAAGATGTTPYASMFAGDRHVGSESNPGYETVETLLGR